MPLAAPENDLPTTLPPAPASYRTAWPWVLCLIGLDYFSTLGYQPSIAIEAAGPLAPVATLVVILATFLGVLPIYWYLAARSPHGDGSLVILERLIRGWRGKTLILILLGFAATDFIFTKTLSVADAAVHLTECPVPAWQKLIERMAAWDDELHDLIPHPAWEHVVDFWDRQMVATVLLLLVGSAFWWLVHRGFNRRVLQISVVVVGVYLLLNALVIGGGIARLSQEPELVVNWWQSLARGSGSMEMAAWIGPGWHSILLMSLWVFPSMALGLSGWELSMLVMPLISGRAGDTQAYPRGRIRGTRALLLTAALLMSVYLLGSVLVTTLLVPPRLLQPEGAAHNRALAYLAHGGATKALGAEPVLPWCGPVFGVLYDASTICILCLAGASVIVVLRRLVPQYLQRFGMELHWAHNLGLIFHGFGLISLLVTLVFRASVSSQRGAFATSVLLLITGAAFAAFKQSQTEPRGRLLKRPAFFLLTLGFLSVAAAVIAVRPSGIIIAGAFIAVLIFTSMASRLLRSTELRFQGFEFADPQSRLLWNTLQTIDTPMLIPHRPGRHSLVEKEADVRRRHHLGAELLIVFLEAEITDASDFYQLPLMQIVEQEGRFVIRVRRCVSVAHVIAAVALELAKVGPRPEIHFGWSNESTLAVNLNFVLFGEGNIPWLTRELIRKAVPETDKQPRITVG